MTAHDVWYLGGVLRDRHVNVHVRNGTIVEIVDLQPGAAHEWLERVSREGSAAVDLSGRLLLPAAADAHAHLDKALSWDAIRSPMGDLEGAIESWKAFSAGIGEENIHDRALREAESLIARGVTTVRTHVDLHRTGDALRGIRAVARVRDELNDMIDLEIVALGSQDISDADYLAAVDAGADLIGGAPHLAEDPLGELGRVIHLADRAGVGMDLHTDEALEGVETLPHYARGVAAIHQHHPERVFSAGHCVLQGTLASDPLDATLDEVLNADMGIVTLPITNLYLQGWQHPVSTPRGLTALRRMIERGIRLGAGADNVRDPFNPVGRSDFLETAMLLIVAGHLTADEAIDLTTNGSRRVMGRAEITFLPGSPADFVAIGADSLMSAISEASMDRLVVHRGRLVARSTQSTLLLSPEDAPGGRGSRNRRSSAV